MAINPVEIMKARLSTTPGVREILHERIEYAFVNPVIGERQFAQLPPEVLERVNWPNASDGTNSVQLRAQRRYTKSAKCTVKKGISHDSGVKFNVRMVDFTASLKVSYEETSETGETEEQSFEKSFTVQILPNRRVEVVFSVSPLKTTYSMEGKAHLSGSIQVRYRSPGGSIVVYPHFKIGEHFRKHPHAEITVVDDDTVAVPMLCEVVTIVGAQIDISTTDFPL